MDPYTMYQIAQGGVKVGLGATKIGLKAGQLGAKMLYYGGKGAINLIGSLVNTYRQRKRRKQYQERRKRPIQIRQMRILKSKLRQMTNTIEKRQQFYDRIRQQQNLKGIKIKIVPVQQNIQYLKIPNQLINKRQQIKKQIDKANQNSQTIIKPVYTNVQSITAN